MGTADAVDREFESWSRETCLALDLDRSGIYELAALGEVFRSTHTWHRANIRPFPRHYDPGKFVQTTTNSVMAGNQIMF
jgi:hypothetical protein